MIKLIKYPGKSPKIEALEKNKVGISLWVKGWKKKSHLTTLIVSTLHQIEDSFAEVTDDVQIINVKLSTED